MTGETEKGNAPAGAARIVDFGDVMGGWKAYMYGDNLERLLNVSIDAGQSGAVVTLDWYYIRDNKQDKVFEDTTASSTFTGAFDGGMLDATGSGRIMLTAFWEKDGHSTPRVRSSGRAARPTPSPSCGHETDRPG